MNEDNLEYIDINEVKDRNEELINFLLDTLKLDTQEFKYENNKGEILNLPFNKLKNQVEIDKNILGHTDTAATNLHRYLFLQFPDKIELIRQEVEKLLREIMINSDNAYQRVTGLEDEVSSLQNEIQEKNLQIKELNEKLQQDRFNFLSQRLSAIENLNNIPQKQNPDKYFNSEVNENIKHENDILYTGDVNVQEKVDIDEPILTKSQRIQNAHKEVLKELEENELYPLHKKNPHVAKFEYENIWNKICYREEFDLSPNDIPKFIFNLDKYVDEEDEYLDIVKDVEL